VRVPPRSSGPYLDLLRYNRRLAVLMVQDPDKRLHQARGGVAHKLGSPRNTDLCFQDFIFVMVVGVVCTLM
jgi:hypothetical protein